MKFSDYAVEKMLGLYNNHAHQVGSRLKEREPINYETYEATDCITYVMQVLKYAYEKAGQDDFSKKVSANLAANKADGTKLAKMLVKEDNWTGIFYNPDSRYTHANENDGKENSYATHIQRKKNTYYDIPAPYAALEYAPQSFVPETAAGGGDTLKIAALIGARISAIAATFTQLMSIKFGFGCSRGGIHTWLFSEGYVYEVHWLEPPDGNLYEKSGFAKFTTRNEEQRTGIIVVPPDAFQMSAYRK